MAPKQKARAHGEEQLEGDHGAVIGAGEDALRGSRGEADGAEELQCGCDTHSGLSAHLKHYIKT